MFEGIEVIDGSSLSVEDKRNLKEFYLKACKVYIGALEKGKEPGDVCSLVYENRFYTSGSRTLKKLGIGYSSKDVSPQMDMRYPLSATVTELCTVHETTITVPVSLLKLSGEELAELIQNAKMEADKEEAIEAEQAKSFENRPRRGFRKDIRCS